MKKLSYLVALFIAFLFCSCEPNIDKPKETIEVNFEVDWYKVRINVDGKDIPTSAPYKTYKNEPLVFSILGDVSFNTEKVEYKYTDTTTETDTEVEEPLYQELTPIDGKYTIDATDKNITLKITVSLNKTTITFDGATRIEQAFIKYKTINDEDITLKQKNDIVVGDDYSFKFDNNYTNKNYYNVKITLTYGSPEFSEELLPNEEGIYTIKGDITAKGVATGITVIAKNILNTSMSISNSEAENVFQIRRIVGEQSVVMPSTYDEEACTLEIKPNAGEDFSFKVELNDPSQFEIAKLQIVSSALEDLTPTQGGVYTIKNVTNAGVQLMVTLNALWYPLTVEGDAEIQDVVSNKILDKLTTEKQVKITVVPKDKTKVVTNVSMEYKDGTWHNTRREKKDLISIKNEDGVNVYTVPLNVIKGSLKFTVTLQDKNISLITSGDSVRWTQDNGAVFPSKIERRSFLDFKVVPTVNGQVVDTVSVVNGDVTITLLPNENGIYTLTPDITILDSITLSATTKKPTNKTTITFKGNGVVFKENVLDAVITEKSITENSEFRFKVELEDSVSCEMDRVYAVYNGKLIELKSDNGIYTLSSYVTAFNTVVVAEAKVKTITLKLDATKDYIITDVNGGPFKETIPYRTEYKFKVVPSDTSKKITRIRLQQSSSLITMGYLYPDKNGAYTLQNDYATDNITLLVDTVNVEGEELTVIEKDQTVNVENKDGKIPYVLITSFTPSETYASEPLRSSDTRSNNIYNYSLAPNSVSQKSLYSSVTPRAISSISAPEMKNGKVVWNNYMFARNGQTYYVNYKELYTDTSNKIIYLISNNYPVDEGSRAREIIDCMYSDPNSNTKMQPDMLLTLQKSVATPSDTFPNKSYLFDKSETDRGYFFIMIDRFSERGYGNGTLGYFDGGIYTGNAKNTPYASFFLDTGIYGFDGNGYQEGYASNIISTLSHEYTHYLENDYKNTNNNESISSIHFLSEGYANYNAAKGMKNESSLSPDYLKEMLHLCKIYDPKDRDDTNYGLGHLFFLYIEEKYGIDMPGRIMTNDNTMFKTVENAIGKKFGEIYGDFILNLILSGYTNTAVINGEKYGNMSFAKYLSQYGDGEMHAFEEEYSSAASSAKSYKNQGKEGLYAYDYVTGENIYEDVKMILDPNEGIESVLGEMSFRLVCYPNGAPSTLTLKSDSLFIKAYLFYSNKNPLSNP